MEPAVRVGTRLAPVVQALRELAEGARRAVAGGLDAETVRDAYLGWVEIAERMLRAYFVDDDVWRALYSDRYWHVRALGRGSPRPHPLLDLEATAQADRLEALAMRLDRRARELLLPADVVPVVPDTNALVHYRRLDEVPWPGVVDAPAVRLVLPLLVIDELDALSHRSRDVGDRARSLLRFLQRLRGDAAPEEPVAVRSAVTLQVHVDPPGWARSANNDDELLRRIEAMAAATPTAPVLVTGDYGMQLRARARDIRCVSLPDDLRLPPRSHSSEP